MSSPRSSPDAAALRRLELPLGALGLSLVAIAAVFAAAGIPSWIPTAPMARAGFPSPLGGMTRAFVAMTRGGLAEAFAFHPLGPVAFLCAAAAPVIAAISFARGARLEPVARLLRLRALWAGVGAAFVVVWVARVIA